MIPKLSTEESLHKVKMYIFITNEYGKPTEGSIDLFIESFSDDLLLKKDFEIYDRVKNELNTWWSKVEQDLQDRQLQSLIKYTGGFEWFKRLTKESKKLTKEQEEQFKDDRDSFKEWIYSIEVEKAIIEEHQKYNYKLIRSDFIGKELKITESVDNTSSSYKANIVDEVNIKLADTGLIVNINKFIEEVENRNVKLKIKSGFFKFDFLYKEEK